MINVYIGYVWHEGFNNLEVGMRVNGHTYGKFIWNADRIKYPTDYLILYTTYKLNKAAGEIDEQIALVINDKELKRISRSEKWLSENNWTTDKNRKVDQKVWGDLYKLINSSKVKVKKILTTNDEQEIAIMMGDLKKGWLYNESGKTRRNS